MTVQKLGDWTVCTPDGPAVDATNFREVEGRLRDSSLHSTKLAVDWSNVVYVDLMGIEAVLDAIADHPKAAAFVGVDRNLRHLLKRMQLLPVLPLFDTIDSLKDSG
jgi:anti-anti-sigma regulatory factor